MRVISPVLQAMAGLSGTFGGSATWLDTHPIDFNLSRLTGVVINSIEGTIKIDADIGLIHVCQIVQELDLDPDNVDIENGGVVLGDYVNLDSSRVFRQKQVANNLLSATPEYGFHSTEAQKMIDFTRLPLEGRPISITNLSHHARGDSHAGGLENPAVTLIIRYQIVALSLAEVGYVNASRR